MSVRDEYRKKFEAQIEEQVARLAVLKARAKQTVADGKIMAYEELAEADRKLTAARARLAELSSASEGAWETMKGGVEQAWNALAEACKKASAQFK